MYICIYIYIHSKYSIYATFSRVTCIHYRHIHKYLNIHIIDIIYAGLYTYRYAYMYIRFQVCRLRTQKKRWRGSSCYQKPMICLVQNSSVSPSTSGMTRLMRFQILEIMGYLWIFTISSGFYSSSSINSAGGFFWGRRCFMRCGVFPWRLPFVGMTLKARKNILKDVDFVFFHRFESLP